VFSRPHLTEYEGNPLLSQFFFQRLISKPSEKIKNNPGISKHNPTERASLARAADFKLDRETPLYVFV
jgi:hypothetical protein